MSERETSPAGHRTGGGATPVPGILIRSQLGALVELRFVEIYSDYHLLLDVFSSFLSTYLSFTRKKPVLMTHPESEGSLLPSGMLRGHKKIRKEMAICLTTSQ